MVIYIVSRSQHLYDAWDRADRLQASGGDHDTEGEDESMPRPRNSNHNAMVSTFKVNWYESFHGFCARARHPIVLHNTT